MSICQHSNISTFTHVIISTFQHSNISTFQHFNNSLLSTIPELPCFVGLPPGALSLPAQLWPPLAAAATVLPRVQLAGGPTADPPDRWQEETGRQGVSMDRGHKLYVPISGVTIESPVSVFCTCVYTYISTHVYTYIHAYTRIYTHIHAYTHIYIHICTRNTHVYPRIYIHVHTPVYADIHIEWSVHHLTHPPS